MAQEVSGYGVGEWDTGRCPTHGVVKLKCPYTSPISVEALRFFVQSKNFREDTILQAGQRNDYICNDKIIYFYILPYSAQSHKWSSIFFFKKKIK